MRQLFRLSVLAGALTVSTLASAQTSSQSGSSSEELRPATTTASGTTGIWYVPTADVLPNKKWSASFYRTNLDDGQGFSDISTFPATFAVGVGDHAEIFGSWALVTRIDRDSRPLFFQTPDGAKNGTGGGLLVDYPFVRGQWTGNKLGDLWLGGKVNLLNQRTSPVGIGVRAMIKLPVGDDDAGTSTGETDFAVDGIVSVYHPVAELSGFAGALIRGNPDGYQLTNGLRWGVGAAFPQRYNLGFRVTAELFGESYFNKEITAPAGLTGIDGSFVPTSTTLRNPVVASLGLNWQAPNGFFVGGAASWNLGMKNREDAGAGNPNTPKDDKGLQVRIGFHPGTVRSGASPAGPTTQAPPVIAAPPAAAQPAPAAPANRPPTVVASCNPCTVEVGRTSTVSADAQDPDGDPLTYRWSAPAGTLASPTSRQSLWTAPGQEGPVPFTVAVDDGKGGTASSSVTIQVVRPVQQQYTFEDVHFEFDRYTLRADALHVLDDAVTAMKANPALRLTIEGHTCNIGTAEYNLALGERRARAVRDYLTAHGVDAERLQTISYGEERPKYDNNREETRRLNRRAALVVRLQ